MPRNPNNREQWVAGQLPIVTLNNRQYYVDGRLQELRNIDEFMDVLRAEDIESITETDRKVINYEFYGN